VLVFLHLLEGKIERIGKRLLVHAQEQATRSDSAADFDIDRVWHTSTAPVFRSQCGVFSTLLQLPRRCPSHPILSCVFGDGGSANTDTGRWVAVE
jgi:hypothetical protein